MSVLSTLERLHRPPEHRALKCQMCGYQCVSDTDFSLHRANHLKDNKRNYQCTYCQKLFGRLDILKTHMMTHTGERPYKCEVCGKGFTARANYRQHLLTHTESGDLPHKCSLCRKSFIRKDRLRNHIAFTHGVMDYTSYPNLDQHDVQDPLVKRNILP